MLQPFFSFLENLWMDYWAITRGEETKREQIREQTQVQLQALTLDYQKLQMLKNALYMAAGIALIYIILKET